MQLNALNTNVLLLILKYTCRFRNFGYIAMEDLELINDCVRSVICCLNASQYSRQELILKREQEIAVKELLVGKHVLAVLPTGYGKSLIFTLFLLAREEMSRRLAGACGSDRISVLVVCPLRSIISDQIAEMISLGCSAVELSTETLSEIIRSPPQFINSSAESAIMKEFLNGLMKSSSPLHRSLCCIVVDESHTIETWTGQR